jgi:hypothetical protein
MFVTCVPLPWGSRYRSHVLSTKERDGWYSTAHFERIKTVLRHKFFSLLEGHVPTDEECKALLVVNPFNQKVPTSRTQKLRPGKHNMAKGALRPEDAAVSIVLHILRLFFSLLRF